MLKREVKEKHISSVEIRFDSLDDLLDGPILGRSVKAAPAITSSSKIPEASEAGEATIAHLVPRSLLPVPPSLHQQHWPPARAARAESSLLSGV